MSRPTVLLISSDDPLVAVCRQVTGQIPGLELATVQGMEEIEPWLAQEDLTLILAHLVRKSDVEGIAGLLRRIDALRRPIPLVVLGERHAAEEALHLLRLGAADYLDRPLDITRLSYLVDLLTVRARYMARRAVVPAPSVESLGDGGAFLYSPTTAMGEIIEQVKRVAPQMTTVLLGGETGTGKTRLARLIHDLSPRREEPFLTVNCGSLAPTLIESEMFGHVRGAFTGADRDRTGKFADAGRGTLFLDEIDSLPLTLQAKLLRAVEERVFEPVGSNKSQPMQARLIVASNRHLDQEMAAGRFRPDLYYRLNVVSFHLPPLRERRQIIPGMATKFIAEFAARNSREVRGASAEVLRALEAYNWPGNIRELRNVLERAVALCPGMEIALGDLPEAIQRAVPPPPPSPAPERGDPPPAASLVHARQEAEAARIREVLRRHGNNRLRAAAELGISRMTLYKKLHQYGLMGR